MIVVDSSALIAILEREDDALRYARSLQTAEVLRAFDRYGKGLHPRARLNLADCAAYALAKTTGAPLLFKGGDFAATDLIAPD